MFRPMLVWVTRTAPYNLLTAHRLRAMGHSVLTVPLLRVAAVEPSPPGQRSDALVFTSSHGVRHHGFAPAQRDLPVFTVGDHTAEAARRAGYADVRSARGNVLTLQRLIVASLPAGARIAHLGAEQPAGDLAGTLCRLGYQAEHRAVYRSQDSAPEDLEGALAALPAVEAITVHSPRAARAAAEIVRATGWFGMVFCISSACAAEFRALGGLLVETAARPDEAALLSRLRTYAGRSALPAARLGPGRAAVLARPVSTPPPFPSRTANDNDPTPSSRPCPAEPGDGGSPDDPPPSAA
ncbi:uroporphyrinogen-III synthase [Sphingomonas parva]|uniref:Uroporphyrinogen-III synthase n=1 Tax=Sphingomonas parva TaxID=2555898 RepID=A0A4Y8ZPS5_9SPHN|nr:uroporphyrinogen-III synthase [Sphingomonas parva]TFI58008.1 uroporphyrinogen-III synthase [Sphingomonas parva]